MKEITKLMINEFKIKKLGYDFMGYKLQKDKSLTFHHLIIPRRNNGPETRWNGAIIQRIPHDYLHIIEEYDARLSSGQKVNDALNSLSEAINELSTMTNTLLNGIEAAK